MFGEYLLRTSGGKASADREHAWEDTQVSKVILRSLQFSRFIMVAQGF